MNIVIPAATQWARLPIVLRAVATGFGMAAAVTLPWALLLSLNVRYAAVVPWAAPITLAYVWVWWRYATGEWWRRVAGTTRRERLRAIPVAEEIWGISLLSGALGIATCLLIGSVAEQLSGQSSIAANESASVPLLTALSFAVTSAIVAGVVEEGSFRGYMQVPIEQRHGPFAAIAVTAGAFALAHAANPEFSPVQIPFYVSLGTVFGLLAYLTGSILPGLALHVAAVALDALNGLITGHSRAVTAAQESGAGTSLWILLTAMIILSAATATAFSMLAQVTRRPHNSSVGQTRHGAARAHPRFDPGLPFDR